MTYYFRTDLQMFADGEAVQPAQATEASAPAAAGPGAPGAYQAPGVYQAPGAPGAYQAQGASGAPGAYQAQEAAEAPGAPQADERFGRHVESLRRQSEELRRSVPGFDLARELNNPVFLRMTSPAVGLGVEDAYYAVHRRELQSEAAQTALRQVSGAISSNRARPVENGTTARAGAAIAMDYRSASLSQREKLKSDIRRAAARGEKLYPAR